MHRDDAVERQGTMSDRDPQDQEQPSKSDRRIVLEAEHLDQDRERLDELLPQRRQGKRGGARRDRPANASALEAADIPRERQRNTVRREQEDLKDRRLRRRCLMLVLGLLGIAIVASAAVIGVALGHGDYARVVPLVPVLGGSGGAGVFAWNAFSKALIVETPPPAEDVAD